MIASSTSIETTTSLPAEIATERRDACARFRERRGGGGDHVEDAQIVTGAHEAPRHALPHPAQTDETHFHGYHLTFDL